MNLRKSAKGQPCLIRVPGVCNGNPETTVLCHVRMIGISGYGMKSSDCLAAYGCFECHNFVDNRSHPHNTPEYRRQLLLEGVMRTQAYWICEGILKW